MSWPTKDETCVVNSSRHDPKRRGLRRHRRGMWRGHTHSGTQFEDHFETVHAIDTSKPMITRARRRVPNAIFEVANGIDVAENSWGVAVSAFMFHELPKSAQIDVLSALVKSSPDVWIMDIHTSYTPSKIMLTGEPFLMSYLRDFDAIVRNVSSRLGHHVHKESLIDGHVMVWRLTGDNVSK